jgi:hypothetical protein
MTQRIESATAIWALMLVRGAAAMSILYITGVPLANQNRVFLPNQPKFF